MKRWGIIIPTILAAAWMVVDTVREFSAKETIRYFSSEPKRLLDVAAIAIVGGFAVLGFDRLSTRAQQQVRVFAWGAAASTMTAFVGYIACCAASISALIIKSGASARVLPWVAVSFWPFLVITFYLWFEFYRTWKTGVSR